MVKKSTTSISCSQFRSVFSRDPSPLATSPDSHSFFSYLIIFRVTSWSGARQKVQRKLMIMARTELSRRLAGLVEEVARVSLVTIVQAEALDRG
jgi:hypothetical protein